MKEVTQADYAKARGLSRSQVGRLMEKGLVKWRREVPDNKFSRALIEVPDEQDEAGVHENVIAQLETAIPVANGLNPPASAVSEVKLPEIKEEKKVSEKKEEKIGTVDEAQRDLEQTTELEPEFIPTTDGTQAPTDEEIADDELRAQAQQEEERGCCPKCGEDVITGQEHVCQPKPKEKEIKSHVQSLKSPEIDKPQQQHRPVLHRQTIVEQKKPAYKIGFPFVR